jgi:hypothetical protein
MDEMKREEVFDSIAAAYHEGHKNGVATGDSDSPRWNAGEDWACSDTRKRLLAMISQFPPTEESQDAL